MTTKQLFFGFLALSVVTMLALAMIDMHLQVASAPMGIVSFEFCGFTGACAEILSEWGARGQAWVMLSLGLDYLFLVAYAGGLCAGLLWVSDGMGGPARSIARLAAAAALLAGVADAVENAALIRVLVGPELGPYAWVAAYSAVIKFTLVSVALLAFVVVGVLRVVRARVSGSASP
jgi:hypothetical protein